MATIIEDINTSYDSLLGVIGTPTSGTVIGDITKAKDGIEDKIGNTTNDKLKESFANVSEIIGSLENNTIINEISIARDNIRFKIGSPKNGSVIKDVDTIVNEISTDLSTDLSSTKSRIQGLIDNIGTLAINSSTKSIAEGIAYLSDIIGKPTWSSIEIPLNAFIDRYIGENLLDVLGRFTVSNNLLECLEYVGYSMEILLNSNSSMLRSELFSNTKNLLIKSTPQYLGTYPNDYNIESLRGRPIAWRVLDTNITKGTALVISENVIENHIFDSDSSTYSSSDIQAYLRGDFISTYGLSGVNICNVDVTSDVETTTVDSGSDKVFLLSKTEAETYFADNNSRITYFNNGNKSYWWLRTNYNTGIEDVLSVYNVTNTGAIGTAVPTAKRPIRPAFWYYY